MAAERGGSEQGGRPGRAPVGSRPAGLWYGVLAGPVGWGLHLQASYVLVPHACAGFGGPLALHAVGALTLLVAASGLWPAVRTWRALGDGRRLTEGAWEGGARWMALCGIILSLYFSLVIAAETLPVFLVHPCA